MVTATAGVNGRMGKEAKDKAAKDARRQRTRRRTPRGADDALLNALKRSNRIDA